MNKVPISKESAFDLLHNAPGKKGELAKKVVIKLDADNAIILKDNRVLIYEGDLIFLSDMHEIFQFVVKRGSTHNNLQDPKQVIDNLQSHLDTFFEIFTSKKFDYSLNSLKFVDKEFKRLEKAGKDENDLFLPVVVYIGEIMKKHVSGVWQINDDGKLIILGADGKQYDCYFNILSIITRGHKSYAFESAIRFELG